MKCSLRIIVLAIGILTPVLNLYSAARAQSLGELPFLNDGQRLTLPAIVVATADVNSNTPTVVTLEERFDWCGNRYFTPNIDFCMEKIGSSGGMIRTVWAVNFSARQVTASGELTNSRVVDVNFRNYSKDTQTAFRAYAYACPNASGVQRAVRDRRA